MFPPKGEGAELPEFLRIRFRSGGEFPRCDPSGVASNPFGLNSSVVALSALSSDVPLHLPRHGSLLLHLLSLLLLSLSLGLSLLHHLLLSHHLLLRLTRRLSSIRSHHRSPLSVLHRHAVFLDQSLLLSSALFDSLPGDWLTRSSSDMVPTSLPPSPNACAEWCITVGFTGPSPSIAYV